MGIGMKIVDYLKSKYLVDVPNAMRKSEAIILKIAYPLEPGWLAKHGDTEITEDQKARLLVVLERKIDDHSKRAFDLLGGVRRAKDDRPKSLSKMAKKMKARADREAARQRAAEARELARLASHGDKPKKRRKPRKQRVARNVTQASTESSVKRFVDFYSKVDPRSDDFLSSFEWKAVRMMALKRYGPVCQCCGASPATGAVMNVDHIKPRKLFPQLALDVDNLQILCGDCNHGKGNWDMTDWRTATHDNPSDIACLRQMFTDTSH